MVVLVMLGGGWGVVWFHREPTYLGKTLPEWAAEAFQDTNDVAAQAGFARIVPQAVPYYAKILLKTNSSSDWFYRQLWLHLPKSLQLKLAEPVPLITARINAALVLKSAGQSARGAIPDIIACLKDPDDGIRQTAVEALEEVAPQAPEMLPVFMQACNDPFNGVRRTALEALGFYGPGAKVALPALMSKLRDQDLMVRACAAGALWEVDHQTNDVMRALAETFHDPSPTTRALSAMYLGHMGKAALPMVPTLVGALNDIKEVAAQAREALMKIDPETADRAGIR